MAGGWPPAKQPPCGTVVGDHGGGSGDSRVEGLGGCGRARGLGGAGRVGWLGLAWVESRAFLHMHKHIHIHSLVHARVTRVCFVSWKVDSFVVVFSLL